MLTSIEWTSLYGLYQEGVVLDNKINNELSNQEQYGVCENGKELSRLNIVRQYIQDRIDELERKMND